MKYIWHDSDIRKGVRATMSLGKVHPVLKMYTILEIEHPGEDKRKFVLMDEVKHSVSVPYHASEIAHNFTEANAAPNPPA